MTRLTFLISMLFCVAGFAGTENWHEDAFFGLHYDLHPNANDTELGRETTYQHIREQLEKVKPDFVQYDCKGHPGWAGYPTEVGSPSPGIVGDALKIWREVTRDMGIPLSIHFSGVWDSRAIELHPKWARIDANGKAHERYTDPLSGYTEELMIPQLLEVVEKYDIDGVWIDGENWASLPSWSDACIKEFTSRTGIEEVPRKSSDEHWHEWLSFQRDLFIEHVKKYADALHAKKPNLLVCSNWLYSVRQPESVVAPIDFLSGDFSPSWGPERACAEGRFISSRGMPWDLMLWSFTRTGGLPHTMKHLPHLCQEAAMVMAQGGGVFVYNQPQRSGRLTGWHQDLFARLAQFCRKRQAYCHKSETIPQIAVLHSETHFYRHCGPLYGLGSAVAPIEGALHALLENGYSVDMLNEATLLRRVNEYPVVVIPELEGLPDEVKGVLKEYVNNGGNLLLSGPDAAAEYPELAGVKPVEGERHNSAWLPAGEGCVSVNGPWQAVTLEGATQVAALLSQQEPKLNQTGRPAATVNRFGKGTVVAIHGPVFQLYQKSHYPRLRRFIGDVVQAMDTQDLLQVHGPWWIEMSARKLEGRGLIQLVNRSSSGHLAPNRHSVEHVPDTGPFTLTVPMKERPKRCYLAPDEVGLEWTWDDGILEAKVAGLAIHNVLVVE